MLFHSTSYPRRGTATLVKIEEQGFSLNPGRYSGMVARAEEGFVFAERLEELNEELSTYIPQVRREVAVFYVEWTNQRIFHGSKYER